MRVLGVDPGYAIAGYGVLDSAGATVTPVTFGVVTTEAHTPFIDRLEEVYDDFTTIMETTKPDVMAIETLFYTTNQKTAMAVAEARGVILLAAKKAGLALAEYSPLQVKQSVTGYGRATKEQVQQMIVRLLSLKEAPTPDDATDALAIALCHAHSARSAQFGKNTTRRQQMGYY